MGQAHRGWEETIPNRLQEYLLTERFSCSSSAPTNTADMQ